MEDLLVEDGNVTLTIRLIMQGKEVGSIIGKKGEIVKRFREESGAKINISDGSCPERIVTVSGTTKAIYKAFLRITKKFEEWCSQFSDSPGGKTQIPIRLIVPASQCGSLIGKGGSKIKEIRELTGCSIQVASEMLPNSTERAVTLNGSAEQITQCIFQICNVMLESPPKGATIPYRPKPQVNGPVILANGQAYTIQGNFALPTQETCTVYPLSLSGGGLQAAPTPTGLSDPLLKGTHLAGAVAPHHLQPIHDIAGLTKNPLAGLAAVGLAGMAPSNTAGINPVALAALAGSQLRSTNPTRTPQTNTQQQEMTVPNDLIGCIIGKGGTKIAEIRQISGAMIRISNCEEREAGNTDRTITISGNPDAVAVAQYLINMSVELQRANLTDGNNQTSSSSSTASNTNFSAAAVAAAAAHAAAANNGTGSSSAGVGGDMASLLANANGNAAAAAAAAALGLTNGASTAVSQSPQSLTSSMSNTNASSTSSSPGQTITPTPAALAPLAQLLAKPGAINALTSITALSGLQDFLGGLAGMGAGGCNVPGAGAATAPTVQTTGVHRMPKGNGNGLSGMSIPRMRGVPTGASLAAAALNANGNSMGGDKKNDRNKFNPY